MVNVWNIDMDGVLMTVTILDGNGPILPAVFALVPKANSENGMWFVLLLRDALGLGKELACRSSAIGKRVSKALSLPSSPMLPTQSALSTSKETCAMVRNISAQLCLESSALNKRS